ncbi:MAG: hypothetical protein AB7O78_16400 [Thermoleophilia bacterium]
MPGTLWHVSCESCRASWEVQAGALPRRSFLPARCARCAAVVTAECEDDDWRCTDCGSIVEPLPGAELEPGRELPDPVMIACPACAAEGLRAFECGLWD